MLSPTGFGARKGGLICVASVGSLVFVMFGFKKPLLCISTSVRLSCINSGLLGTFVFLSVIKKNDTGCCFTKLKLIQGNRTKMSASLVAKEMVSKF